MKEASILVRAPRNVFGFAAALVIPLQAGCSVADLATADRYARGFVVVLPGIEGRSIYNVSIARGLDEGHVPGAIEIFDWGTGTPGGFLVNLTALERNRRQAEKIARRIRRYQEAFPGRPVHLVAHSGGAGIALMALEALPAGRQITATFLLAAAVSPDRDLTAAMRRTQLGIWNFHSPRDLSFLAVGTTVFGTMDRKHTPAAGVTGFVVPENLSEEGRTLYATKLHQARHNRAMAKAGNDGSHFGCVNPRFVRKWLAPMILADARAVSGPRYSAPRVATRETASSAPPSTSGSVRLDGGGRGTRHESPTAAASP